MVIAYLHRCGVRGVHRVDLSQDRRHASREGSGRRGRRASREFRVDHDAMGERGQAVFGKRGSWNLDVDAGSHAIHQSSLRGERVVVGRGFADTNDDPGAGFVDVGTESPTEKMERTRHTTGL